MTLKGSAPRKPGGKMSQEERDRIVAKAREAWKEREQSYREQSLIIHPWVCARCGRHFNQKNLHELTVHHKDHNHDNNPPDGSNWENLCIYCHDNEHRRYLTTWLQMACNWERKRKRLASRNPLPISRTYSKPKKNEVLRTKILAEEV